ncbi:unnamed protein product [Ilex paraguariensis]|uniref:FAR1 domain-containing protein n=1 Tax=Ilex paraguariensis TaxID=185542 RepID=A0ABC8V4B8_9AQUA
MEEEIPTTYTSMKMDVDEIVEYYIRYGNGLGFPIKRRTSSKGDDGELRFETFACSRSGKSKSTSKNAFQMRLITKIDCKAKLRATICPDGMW